MGDVNAHIIRPMITLYGELKSDNAEELLAVYERLLKHFHDKVLRRAFDEVAASYTPSFARPWPMPAHFRKACEKHAVELQPKPSMHLPDVMRAPPDRSDIDAYEKAAAWRAKVVDEYGSMDNYLTKTRATRKGAFDR